MPLLPPGAYGTLGVTHDHPLLGVEYSSETRKFEVHLAGAYVLGQDEGGPQQEYTDVRVRVEDWQDAKFEAHGAQPCTAAEDTAAVPVGPFDPRTERLAEVDDLDLTPDVRLSGWLVFAPHEFMRWYTITFEGAAVTVTYTQVRPLDAARSG